MSGSTYPERVTVYLPNGFKARLRAVANGEGTDPAEYARRAIREALAASERRAAREGR